MREIDLQNTDHNQVLVAELLALGFFNRKWEKEEIKLLPAPRDKRSKLLFDPELEADYLREQGLWKTQTEVVDQFKTEIETAIWEKEVATFSQSFCRKNGDLVEKKSGLGWERLLMYSVSEEAAANREIKDILDRDKTAMVVHISPNNEELGYGDNMIAVWVNDSSGAVQRLGFKVKGDMGSLTELYKQYGGDREIKTNYDLLRNPIEIKNLRLDQVLSMMTLEKESGKATSEQISTVVSEVVDRFFKSRGKEILENSDLILRIYSAAKVEVGRLAAVLKRIKTVTQKVVRSILERMPFHLYNEGRMKKTKEKGGACGLEDEGGEFSKQGWILEIKNGELKAHRGSTEGLTFCSRCGCWHEGKKCPFCDKS